MSITNLGKKVYTVLRDVDDDQSGEWVDGEWIPATKKEIKIKANIQPAFSFNQTRLLPEGDRDKEAIWGSSNQWVYTSRSGARNLEPDVIVYNGTLWEVKATMPYLNFGKHVEFVAIKIKDQIRPRTEGDANDALRE